jgi:hypothetical protein
MWRTKRVDRPLAKHTTTFGRSGPCQASTRGAPRHGHHTQRDRGGAALADGTADEVREVGRIELGASKGKASDMVGGARGGG